MHGNALGNVGNALGSRNGMTPLKVGAGRHNFEMDHFCFDCRPAEKFELYRDRNGMPLRTVSFAMLVSSFFSRAKAGLLWHRVIRCSMI